MRVLAARIFSKFFGGKIKNFHEGFPENNSFLKKKKKAAHAYFGRPYFSKSFGGKIKFFLQGLVRVNLDSQDIVFF